MTWPALPSAAAETYGFDLSAEVIAVTRERFARFGYKGNLDVMPSEAMLYDDAMFDLVFIVDILHHANIPATAAEIKRVLKPGGRVIGDELYTHSVLQRLVRQSLPVRAAYKHLVPWIYGTDTPYITADEHKIDEAEFASFASIFVSLEIDYFDFCAGRLFPGRFATPTKLDRIAQRAFSGGGRFLAGRVVFEGVV